MSASANRAGWGQALSDYPRYSVDVARGRASLRNRIKGPSIMRFEDEAEQSFGRPCHQTNGVQADHTISLMPIASLCAAAKTYAGLRLMAAALFRMFVPVAEHRCPKPIK